MNTRFIARSAIIAAVYAALTVISYPLSYGMVQFRISEIMTLLVFFNPAYIPGLLVGCFAANILGIGGMVDAIFGTAASAFAFLLMVLIKKLIKGNYAGLFLSSLCPAVSGFIIALEMRFALRDAASFWLWYGWIAFGEIAVVTLIGVPLFAYLMKNRRIKKALLDIKKEAD